ncbi:hypothetical protein COOONC_01792 [Cooperia oncophora]
MLSTKVIQGLMSGLIYNRPEEPLKFLEMAIAQIRAKPDEEYRWDMFIDKRKGPHEWLLIYNRPEEPLKFLEMAIAQIRAKPDEEYRWDMFIDKRKASDIER